MNEIKRQLCEAVKSKQCWLTFCTTFAVTIIAIVLLLNNTNVNAFTSEQITIEDIETQVAADDGFIEDEFVEDNAIVEAQPNFDELQEKIVEIKSGDTLIKILTDMGLEYQDANDLYIATKKIYDPRNLKIGQKLQVKARWNAENELVELDNIVSTIKTGERVIIEKDESGSYLAQIQKDELIEEINAANGTIDGNLSSSMSKQKVPSKIIASFINIFSYSVDFRRDVKKGDKFEIIYENYLTSNGELVKNGNILYAALHLGKNKVELYRFQDQSGSVDFYDSKGLALKKTLSRKPMSYQNARISSPFGKRRHPIYRDVRIHWGIDYAAPKNSLIYAAGDGVIMAAKHNSGYGKYIKIRHNSEYSTAYGHLNQYAKGIKPGTRVKQGQVIGYVGSTGRSTGPHLHYEVIKNGRRVNPLAVKASASENLSGKNLANFRKTIAKIQQTYNKMLANKNISGEEKLAQNTSKTAKQN